MSGKYEPIKIKEDKIKTLFDNEGSAEEFAKAIKTLLAKSKQKDAAQPGKPAKTADR